MDIYDDTYCWMCDPYPCNCHAYHVDENCCPHCGSPDMVCMGDCVDMSYYVPSNKFPQNMKGSILPEMFTGPDWEEKMDINPDYLPF